jgi:hypothetical protein
MRPDPLVEANHPRFRYSVAIIRGGLEHMEASTTSKSLRPWRGNVPSAFWELGIARLPRLLDFVPVYVADVPSDAGSRVAAMASQAAQQWSK